MPRSLASDCLSSRSPRARLNSEPSWTDGIRKDQVRNSDYSESSSGPPSQLLRAEGAGITAGATPGPGQTPQGHRVGHVAQLPRGGGPEQ